jgi:hypothetical protein
MTSNMTFASALVDLVQRCAGDIDAIKEARTRMKKRLDAAAADYGIDPGAVRRLVAWLEKQSNSGNINHARAAELDDVYRSIMNGGTPAVLKRTDTELDKVMALITGKKLPKIDDIMEAIGCSRGKAHKLRILAAARLAAEKSSCSSKSREHELLNVPAEDQQRETPSHNHETDGILVAPDPWIAVEASRTKLLEIRRTKGVRS